MKTMHKKQGMPQKMHATKRHAIQRHAAKRHAGTQGTQFSILPKAIRIIQKGRKK